MSRQIGLMIVAAGALLIGLGLLLYSGALRWFGKLPAISVMKAITYSFMRRSFRC